MAIGISSEQARQLLQLAGNDLHTLAKMPVSEISRIDGISTSKALRVSAVFEIGRRRRATPASIRPKVKCSQDA